MQHSLQDAIDTAARRAPNRGNTWHPLMAAVETEPGLWHMVGTTNTCYGEIRFIRRGQELGYRAVTWAPESTNRELIGYYRTLRAATEATHQRFVASQGSGARPITADVRAAVAKSPSGTRPNHPQ